jgi:Zn-dependent peptidase ImmA (M78 family)
MREEEDIDALLLGDWQTLVVDQRHYMDDRYLNRLRFSVAHELGHYVLHRSVFEQMPRDSIEEWVRFTLNLPDREYGFLEYHANEFAGRFLVPPTKLASHFEAAISQAERSGLKRSDLRDERYIGYLAKPIAAEFAVSGDVIERRLIKEGLWPPR